MNVPTDFRKSRRFDHQATVMLEDLEAGYFYYGLMLNYSSDGMCIVSDAIHNKGALINISLDKPIYKAAPLNYKARVRWCNELALENMEYAYGVGVKWA